MNKRMRRYKNGKRQPEIPEFLINEQKQKKVYIPKWGRNLLGIILLGGMVLYLPPILFRAEEKETQIILETDIAAVLEANEYLKDNPDMDFDGDGLVNADEERGGSDPYRVDSDGDGIMDSAELALTDTNPTLYNGTLTEIVRQKMEETQKTVSSPFKVGNVVMWPDDIESRSYGAVVKTLAGYRFCNFQGWAQFPEGEYAYRTDEGVHRELKKNKDGCVYIPGPDTTVEVYEQPLEMVYQFSFLGMESYFTNEAGGTILCAFLPESGSALLSCRKLAREDLDPDTGRGKETEIKKIQIEPDETRFGRNQILLEDLSQVRASIEDGEPVLTSLFSPENGEAIVEIYGYTAKGDLLAADPDSKEKLGIIQIEERASRLYDQDGNIVQYEWFVFRGLGFESANKDRISFFSVIQN